MKRKSTGSLLLQGLFGIIVCYFAAMLYWSSVDQEKSLLEIKEQLYQIKKQIQTGKPNAQAQTAATPQSLSSFRPHIDESLPNLLQEDPFFEKTLPNMLGAGFVPHGTLQASLLGKPDNLLPLNSWYHISSLIGMCSISVAKGAFGIYETLCPFGAIKMEARGDQEFWIHLRDGMFWEPLKREFFPSNFVLADTFLERHPVTAHDYKFFFDALINPYNQDSGALALRSVFDDIESIEVIDDLTFKVKWKLVDFRQADGTVIKKKKYVAKLLTGSLSPMPVHIYQYFQDGKKIVEEDSDPNTYRNDSVWAQNFKQHWAKNVIVSCGPYVFNGMSDREIKFNRNGTFYNPYATLVDGSKFEFKNGTETMWQDFKLGINDTHNLSPDELLQYHDFLASEQYKKQPYRIKELEYLMHAYNYLAWNLSNPLFSSKKIRQALTMSIDRKRIIDKTLHGLGEEITGPFFKYSPSTDPSIKPYPFDVQAAKRMLAEEGWYDSDGDGIIDKEINGVRVPFRFTITYFVKNGTAKSVVEYFVSALKEVGIEATLNGVDTMDLSATIDEKSFEALFMGWTSGTPPEDPSQLWLSKWAKEKGSSNLVGFSNPEVDKIIEELEFESDPEKRKQLYYAFNAIIHDEQPYTFLYAPKILMLYRDYLQNVFIPSDRQDLVPGANITEPDGSIYWIKK